MARRPLAVQMASDHSCSHLAVKFALRTIEQKVGRIQRESHQHGCGMHDVAYKRDAANLVPAKTPEFRALHVVVKGR